MSRGFNGGFRNFGFHGWGFRPYHVNPLFFYDPYAAQEYSPPGYGMGEDPSGEMDGAGGGYMPQTPEESYPTRHHNLRHHNYPRSAEIAEAQEMLKYLGGDACNLGPYGRAGDGVDGVLGPMTLAALNQFRKDHGLPESNTFYLDAETLKALKLAAEERESHAQWAHGPGGEEISPSGPRPAHHWRRPEHWQVANRPYGGGAINTPSEEGGLSPAMPAGPAGAIPMSAHDRDILIRTLNGEAGNEPLIGQIATMSVIRNRYLSGKSYGAYNGHYNSIADVALEPSQFSAWNGNGNNGVHFSRNNDPARYERLGKVVDAVMAGTAKDPTGGADFYYAPSGMPNHAQPSWYNQQAALGKPQWFGSQIFMGHVEPRPDRLGVAAEGPAGAAASNLPTRCIGDSLAVGMASSCKIDGSLAQEGMNSDWIAGQINKLPNGALSNQNLLISPGTPNLNDTPGATWLNPDKVRAKVGQVLDAVMEKGGDPAHSAVIGVGSHYTNQAEINGIVKKLAEDRGMHFVALDDRYNAGDGIHLTAAGYRDAANRGVQSMASGQHEQHSPSLPRMKADAALKITGGEALSGGQGFSPPVPAGGIDRQTAIYDIAAHTVYMPDGAKLEAHSGLGDKRDDPRYVDIRNEGATPPDIYDLSPRGEPFHGLEALRLTPADGKKPYGRDGLLAHSDMLGPDGDSNGCVSFKNYPAFLDAFKSGEVKHLLVVPHISDAIAVTGGDKVSELPHEVRPPSSLPDAALLFAEEKRKEERLAAAKIPRHEHTAS